MKIQLYEEVQGRFLKNVQQVAADKAAMRPSSLLSQKALEERALLKAREDLDILLASFTLGVECMQKEASVHSSCLSEAERTVAEAALTSLGAALEKEMTLSELEAMGESETSLYQQMGLSKADVEALYLIGKRVVEQDRFKEAYGVFVVLATLAPQAPEIWIGLGQTEQHQERWEPALLAFGQAMQLAPSALAKAGQASCYLQLHQRKEATTALEEAIGLCEADIPFDIRLHSYLEQLKRLL